MTTVEPIHSKEDIEKVEKLLEKQSKRDHLLFVFGINCGLRISDILRLNVGDVRNKTHTHLKGEDNDGWKENFLQEITNRYGFEKIVMENSSGYVLIGLPFFNSQDYAMKAKFEECFERIS